MKEPCPGDFGLTRDDACKIGNRIHAAPLNANDAAYILGAILLLPTVIGTVICLANFNWDRLLPVSSHKLESYKRYLEAQSEWVKSLLPENSTSE